MWANNIAHIMGNIQQNPAHITTQLTLAQHAHSLYL